MIPARGGSKRLPKKNIRLLRDKPLIAWSIEAAQQSQYVDAILVSTEDSEILATAMAFGLETPFVRPAALATDEAKSLDVALHALDTYESQLNKHFDILLLLQPTSPLRTAQHIDEALELFLQKNADAVVSVSECEHSPLLANTLPQDQSLSGFLRKEVMNVRSQDLPKYYRTNGAIYIISNSAIRKSQSFFPEKNSFAYIMQPDVSVDIDSMTDFMFAETLLAKSTNKLASSTHKDL